ncbi:MAG TPA: hypothetical protein V6D09_09685 [Leptolyngbyaceae cyanobacterium]
MMNFLAFSIHRSDSFLLAAMYLTVEGIAWLKNVGCVSALDLSLALAIAYPSA